MLRLLLMATGHYASALESHGVTLDRAREARPVST